MRLEPITNSKIFDDRHFYDDLGQILNAYQTGTVNPESVPGTPGSGDNPNLLFQQQFQDEFGHPLFNSAGPTGSSDPFTQFIPPGGPNLPPIPVMPGQNPTPPSNGATRQRAHSEWAAASGVAPLYLELGRSGKLEPGAGGLERRRSTEFAASSIYDLSSTTFIGFLSVDPGATLEIKAGELVALGLDDEGTIIINSDPVFVVNGPATIGSTHTLTVAGSHNEVDFNTGPTDNKGVIAARQGAIVDFNIEQVTNEAGARMLASGDGSAINFLGISESSPDASIIPA